jgi:alginate O-acetyltransferase complex protein AlgI
MTTRALFYAIAVVGTWMLAWVFRSDRARQRLFLVVSYLLYAIWGWRFLTLLIISSIVNYSLGQFLRRRPSAGRLWLGIAFNLGLLGTFKYLPVIASATAHASWLAALVLPVGISFWTFQALSYLLDLYREENVQPSLLEFCLYMAFWPTALSGPICRLGDLLPQFRQRFAPSYADIRTGLDRVFTGLLMKALAEMLAAGLHPGQGVDAAFDAKAWSGADVWCLVIAYGFQLFFEFAGYSHIVIGAARLFGIQLAENFDRPYLSTTPSVFWTRWHMSLSFWIRDYLFLPLATVRREMYWRNFSLVVSMITFGLWHKGTLLFLIWGAYHGALLVAHRQWQQFYRRTGWHLSAAVMTPVSWLLTLATICAGWIFFRAGSLAQAAGMWSALLHPGTYYQHFLPAGLYVLTATMVVGYFAILAFGQLIQRTGYQLSARLPIELKFAAYAVMFYFAVFHMAEPKGFTYFQF